LFSVRPETAFGKPVKRVARMTAPFEELLQTLAAAVMSPKYLFCTHVCGQEVQNVKRSFTEAQWEEIGWVHHVGCRIVDGVGHRFCIRARVERRIQTPVHHWFGICRNWSQSRQEQIALSSWGGQLGSGHIIALIITGKFLPCTTK
jgi:hypothetical protein